MNLLWSSFIIYTVCVQSTTSTSDDDSVPVINNSDVCKPWSCLYTMLGSLDSEVPRHHFKYMFKGLLPEGEAQDVVEKVMNSCFKRRYEAYDRPGACPLQSLLLCVLDQFIENCPQENLNSKDACTPVRTDVGTKFMYSQGIYRNVEGNPIDPQLLKTTFTSKCCSVPEIINKYIMTDCGLTSLLEYEDYIPESSPTDLDMETTTIKSTNETTHSVLKKVLLLASTYLERN